jgi:uncharacterized protein YbjT (DUF2867 family)
MTKTDVLVIGSTGRVGSELVRQLVAQGKTVKAATRNVSAGAFPESVKAVHFDFEKPETFAPALIDVDKVFLIARPGDNHSDQAAQPFVDEAKREGISLIVNLTAMGAEMDETFMLRVLEKYIESSGVPFVHLRPNWFMQNFDSGPIYAEIQLANTIHLPAADAKLSFIDSRDIAAVACKVLCNPGYENKALTLTGNEALSHFDVTAKISGVAGRTISYVPINEESARSGLEAKGIPSGLVERWTDFFRKVRTGLCAPISLDVETVLGRPPINFDQYVKDYVSSWKK